VGQLSPAVRMVDSRTSLVDRTDPAIWLVRAQRVDRRWTSPHRVGVPREAGEEPLRYLVQERVALDLGGERLELFIGRQFAVDQRC